MIRVSPWSVEEGGRRFKLRPLTVRERIALGEDLAEMKAAEAVRDARAFGASPSFAIEAASQAREEARKSSALILACFGLSGAAMVLAKACDDAEELMAAVDPTVASTHAIACLGVDVEKYESEVRSRNPQ
ncbi:MAG: hypothetical protein EB060_10555 [Proteobacteria bacterium]|nr:hypothetical protein [Pseudomonadota bacterium]